MKLKASTKVFAIILFALCPISFSAEIFWFWNHDLGFIMTWTSIVAELVLLAIAVVWAKEGD